MNMTPDQLDIFQAWLKFEADAAAKYQTNYMRGRACAFNDAFENLTIIRMQASQPTEPGQKLDGRSCSDVGIHRVRTDWERPGMPKQEVVYDDGPLAGQTLVICNSEAEAAHVAGILNRAVALLSANATGSATTGGQP